MTVAESKAISSLSGDCHTICHNRCVDHIGKSDNAITFRLTNCLIVDLKNTNRVNLEESRVNPRFSIGFCRSHYGA